MQQDLFYEERRLLTSATDLLKRRKFQAKHSVGDGSERLPIVYIGTAQGVPLRQHRKGTPCALYKRFTLGDDFVVVADSDLIIYDKNMNKTNFEDKSITLWYIEYPVKRVVKYKSLKK